MDTVTKRELNQDTASVLERVTQCGEIVVTERGTPRWRLSSYQGERSTLERLNSDGVFSPALPDPSPWPAEPGGPAYTEAEVDALTDDMRGDH